jgi:hypothetical protein
MQAPKSGVHFRGRTLQWGMVMGIIDSLLSLAPLKTAAWRKEGRWDVVEGAVQVEVRLQIFDVVFAGACGVC